jgi:site-specific DNA recombinase
VIELHPQAVQRFKANVEALADILVVKDALLELVGTFRSLVESVIVRPARTGKNTKSASGDILPV